MSLTNDLLDLAQSFGELPPPLFTDDDIPRARLTDPVTSHKAADVSQRALKPAKLNVLRMFELHGAMVGSELNDTYALAVHRGVVPKLALDSPRKRAGELLESGHLEVTRIRTAEGNNLEEREFNLTEHGRAALEAGAI